MRPSTLAELADAAGVPVPTVTASSDFQTFIELYFAACDVLVDAAAMDRLFREIAEDCARDGAVWVELHADPRLHVGRLGSSDAEVLSVLVASAGAAEAATGVGVGLVMSADRTRSPADAVAHAELAASTEGVVAFGLANDENGHPPEPFADTFAIARDGGLLSVPHAGELAGPSSVRGALDTLTPRRLGHGVRAVEDAALVDRLAAEGVCCDVCPTSNLTLGLYPSIESHAVGQLLAAGVPVTLNTDDPLMFGSTLVDEYALVRDGLGLSDADVAAIARTSVEYSAMPGGAKAATLIDIDAWLTT